MTVSNNPPPSGRNPSVEGMPLPPYPESGQIPLARAPRKSSFKPGSLPFWAGVSLSALWAGGSLLALTIADPSRGIGASIGSIAMGVSAIVSPLALIWMIVAYAQRASDVRSIAEPLRRQLLMITGESGAAETRIRRFNQGLREQIELLKTAQSMSSDDFANIIERVRTQREELEKFETSGIDQVKEIQDIVRRNMQQIETLMDDKFTMLRILDDRLVQSGDTVSRQTEKVRAQVADLLDEVDGRSQQVADALDRSLRDGKKLADVTRLQEETLTAAASAATEMMTGLSGKIDLSVAHFLERAGAAREEAERLAGALEAQTRSLDDVSASLPVRIGEAENVLRGVADRLFASEQLACEQAVNLSEKLSNQVDGLQGFLDRFNERFQYADGNLQQRRKDFDTLIGRMDSAANTFASTWDVSMTGLNDRASDVMSKFATVNDQTRSNADQIAAHLGETAARYETAATRLHGLSEESSARMNEMAHDITAHLSQFESLRSASDKAGAEVEGRAQKAMQMLQDVMERLLSAREATTTIGETLARDLHGAVDQNEHLIVRLNEAAQMSVRALGIATESLSRQEGESAERSRAAAALLAEAAKHMQSQAEAAEQGLRGQTAALAELLSETRSQMNATEQNLQGFAARALPPVQDVVRQIDVSAEQGLQSMGRYGQGLTEQLQRLQGFHSMVGGMGEDLTRVTNDTISTIEQINTRFTSARSMQQEMARQTLEHFAEISDRLQKELSGLDDQTAKAVQSLQNAASNVSEQSSKLLQSSDVTSGKMEQITANLQNEATQIRTILQKQAEDLANDLGRAEKQFATLGDALQQRTDAAYALLDRVATHYNETTRGATQDLEERTKQLEQVSAQTQGKAEALAATLTQQLTVLGNGTNQLEAQANQIGTASGKALQQLSALNEKITFTNEVANNNARQTITRLDEVNAAITRQSNSLSEIAQTSVGNIQKTATVLGEQTAKLNDNNQRIDQGLKQLSTTASTIHEQTSQIRNAIEQQNQRMATQLSQSVMQIGDASNKLEQATEAALTGADKVSHRFSDISSTASTRLAETCSQLQSMAEKADASLSNYGTNLTQQAASLSIVGEQLTDQYKSMASANDAQREQLLELFEKLGGAHGQASDVAERTIARLSESINQIQHQLGMLSDQSQSTVGNMRDASSGLTEQTNMLIQSAQASEQQARSVLTVTSTLHEQARQMQDQIQANSKQSTDMLSNLVNKLTSGGGELRDFASATEACLASLNNSFTHQTQDMSGIMTSFADRQKSLTIALDAQRDVLNGLLHRLTLAQDETAANAERTASRISEGSAHIERQLEAMDMQAQSTLSSVQIANAGFTDQTGLLIHNAQAAEQQVRAVLSATATLQEQARQLQDQINGDSKRASEALSTLLSRLATGHTELRDISAGTEASLTSLSGSMEHQVQDLNGTMTEIAERQRAMTLALDQQREALNKLLGRLASAQDETAAGSERATQRLSDNASQMLGQIEAIERQAQSAFSSVQIANAGLTEQTTTLTQNAQAAEQQVRSVIAATVTLHEQARQLQDQMQNDSQRVGDTLNALVAKLSSNGTELRDVGTQTENTLTSLSGTMQGQIQELNASMSQIGERQRNMTAALDQQRETLNNLLQRLSTAQEETAANSDRTASRLSEGAIQITRHIEVLGTQAQTTLTAIQTANAGFVSEAGALNMHAQQAEQQMRGVLAVTAGMQEQTRQIREAIQGESARVIEQMNAAVAQLDLTTQALKTQGNSVVNVMDQTALQFATNARQTSDEMMKQLLVLDQTATAAEKRLSTVGEGIEGHIKLVNDVGEEVNAHARQLADSAEYATTRMVALRESFIETDNDSQNIAAQALIRITEVKNMLQNELNGMAVLSQETVHNVSAATQALANQSDALRNNLTMSESALQEVAALVREENAQLPALFNRSLLKMEATVQALKDQTAQSDAVLVGTADRFISVTAAAREALSTEILAIGNTAEQANETLNGFAKALSNQMGLFRTGVSELTEEQSELVTKASDGVTQLSAACDRIAQLRNDAALTAERLTNEFDQIDRRAMTTNQKLTETSSAMAKHVEGLSLVAEKAETNITGASAQFREQLERIRAGLQSQVDDINRGLMQITAQLERTGTTLKTTTVGTVADVERIAQRFDQTSKEAGAQLTEKTTRMRASTEEVSRILSGFGDQLDILLGRFAQAGDGIRRHEGDLSSHLQSALTQLNTVAEKLESSRTMAAEVSDHSVSKLSEVADIVNREMQNLTTGSQTAAGIMRGVSQIYGEQSQTLNHGVREAHTQVLTMNKSIEEMQQRADRMRMSLQSQNEELMGSLQMILNQLQAGGDTLIDAQEQSFKKMQ